MLSVIIPTLNEERYLPLLLKRIKEQNFKDYEIIVADADSDDKTVKIAEEFGCKIVKGGSPAKGRNEGAKIAKGDLFLFIDADNKILSNNFLEKLVKEFEGRNLGVASFPIYPNGGKFDKFIYWFYNLWVKLTQFFLAHATSAVLVKRVIHQKIGGFDEEIKMGEDHEYARRAGKCERFGFLEIEPILTSSRRLENEGRIKIYLKYVLAGIYMIFFGPIKSDIFKYRFVNSLKNNR
ncbi:MAG: glycosyltransferase [Candidatus Nealsonbacteria bacterium]